MSKKTLLAAFATIAALGSAISAQASPPVSPTPEVISVRVPLADLDLGAKAGAAAALNRIHKAARFICGSEAGFSTLHNYLLYQACIKQTSGAAQASLSAQIALAQNGQPADRAVILVSSR